MRAAATIMVLTPRSQSLVVAVRWASPGGAGAFIIRAVLKPPHVCFTRG